MTPRLFKDLTINEGYTDLGTFQLDITAIEEPKFRGTALQNTPNLSWASIFSIKFSSKDKLPVGYSNRFRVEGFDSSYIFEQTIINDTAGVIEFTFPMLPIKLPDLEAGFIIDYSVLGDIENRSEECYIKVGDDTITLYTLITDLVVHDGYLCIYDGVSNYYKIAGSIAIGISAIAVGITETGVVYIYNSITSAWEVAGTINFTQIQYPEELDNSATDGFYATNTNTGTLTTGQLGATGTTFENFVGVITKPAPFYTNLNIEITAPGGSTPIYSNTLNILPGSVNINLITISGALPKVYDNTPTLEDIETISGTTFSSAFTTFLTGRDLDRLGLIQKVGPIKFITDFPTTGVSDEEVKLLQSHVDLYGINPDINQNQLIIDSGFDNLYGIATTPKKQFLDAVVSEDLILFEAAKVHEIITQKQKLFTNVFSGILADSKLKTSAYPTVEGSDYPQYAFANFTNTCQCDDCKSGISPFAYLTDLIKYTASHVNHNVSPIYHPVDYNAFITLITNYFLQPFGSFVVSCDTLHDEYCRVRLVTEVLEKLVTKYTTGGLITAQRLLTLASDRNSFLLLTYINILTQAGTSYDELRNVVGNTDADDKVVAAQKLSDKLGIPLYIPTTLADYTADRIWLTLGNTDPDHDLTAQNLEIIFGFRDTKRNVLTTPPTSLIESWRDTYLRDLWREADYPFSDYTREGVVPLIDSTFKENWKAIIDPDIIGIPDFTYDTSSFVLDPTAPTTDQVYANRKEDTDTFLDKCLYDSGNVSNTSADIAGRILRVVDRNIVGQQIEDEKIYITADGTTWTNFTVFSRVLHENNTDVLLTKSTLAVPQNTLFQPFTPDPKMKYSRILNVVSHTETSGTNLIELTFEANMLEDYLSGGKAKFISSYDTSIFYSTEGTSTWEITNLSFDSTNNKVTFNVGALDTPFFCVNTFTFVYEVEVPLFSDQIVDPTNVVDVLFNTEQYYHFVITSPLTPDFSYYVWDVPSPWPSIIDVGTNYQNLLKLYQVSQSGNLDTTLETIITDNLHLNNSSFSRMMELLIACQKYLDNTFSVDRPTTSDLYELASIFRVSGKDSLQPIWVKEEINYEQAGIPVKLELSGSYFWKSLTAPKDGAWDSTLQTIPNDLVTITDSSRPIIDPEFLNEQDILAHPEADPYRTLYEGRVAILSAKTDSYLDLLTDSTFDPTACIKILNEINTGSMGTTTPEYDILPYLTFQALVDDFNSSDIFLHTKAANVVKNSFAIAEDDFSTIIKFKENYEGDNPATFPSPSDINKSVAIFVTGFKKKQLYVSSASPYGWVNQEITGVFPSGDFSYLAPVKYYNVMNMNFAPGRADYSARASWQSTLAKWNRMPFINPDIVPPENINDFTTGSTVHDIWVARKTTIDTSVTGLGTLFNSTLSSATLLTNFKLIINGLISRSGNYTTPPDNFRYFTDIAVKEANSEDIRPIIDQLGFSITEYRVLAKFYAILAAATVPLLDSEYTDFIDIVIHISMKTFSFAFVQEEFGDDILLCQDNFNVYKPALIDFPMVEILQPNPWRAPHQEIKTWEDTVESRVDQEQGSKGVWETVLEQTEDKTMPVMRDALIMALQNNCESKDETAERLAKMLFVETKDNCCVKHTRISFAIETLQGFIFALQSGVYDTYIDGFSLNAPDFDIEWEWLGSYATWRSAVFVFIYPENLLYPTLKRLQSPAFITLSETIQNASRFSPEDACIAAKNYQSYFEDISQLEMLCTTNTTASVFIRNNGDCCHDVQDTENRFMSFYFGRSAVSKKYYWSAKPFDENTPNSPGFWEELSLGSDKKFIGAYVLATKFDSIGGSSLDSSIWLFYHYWKDNKFKMVYITKDLTIAGSEWSDENEMDLDDDMSPNSILSITPCQHSVEWDFPSFIFTYPGYISNLQGIYDPNHPVSIGGKYLHQHYRYMNRSDSPGFDLSKQIDTTPPPSFNNNFNLFDFIVVADSIISFYSDSPKPISAINHQIFKQGHIYSGITLVFENEIQMSYMGNANYPSHEIIYHNFGGFQKWATHNTLIITSHFFNLNKVNELEISLDSNNIIQITKTTFDSNDTNFNAINAIYPVFAQQDYYDLALAADLYVSGTKPISIQVEKASSLYYAENPFGLIPEITVPVAIDSADCISDMNQRLFYIKANVMANLEPPAGNAIGNFMRPSVVTELIFEAYYFVPMLLALDQQQRGQFPSALSWYKSVYDYTNSILSKRKIFYGLVLEETITNVYTRPSNWLLDPLNPHLVTQTRANAYTKYTLLNIVQCILGYADVEFTMDTVETVPIARKLYTEALDLLKTPELERMPNACETKVMNCLDTSVTLPATWNNLFVELKHSVLSLNSIPVINTVTESIQAIFNGAGEGFDEEATPESYEGKFAAAFALVNSSKPEPVYDSIEDIIDGMADRNNDTWRYILAIDSFDNFNSDVAEMYTTAVAGVSFIDKATLSNSETSDKIAWLYDDVPKNSDLFKYKFIDSTGVQILPKEYAYNPLAPAAIPFRANLKYTNASVLVNRQLLGGYTRSFTPLIDFKFCVPKNPVYDSMQLKANLELYKIFNCRNIAGMVRELDVYAAATDSTSGMPVIGAGGNLILPGIANYKPSQYRFRVLIERSKQLVSLAQQLESQFLAALEKEDAESYNQLRAKQDLQTAKSTVKLQDLRITQANDERTSANLQLNKVTFMKSNFDNLIAGGQNGFEKAALGLLIASAAAQATAATLAYTSLVGNLDDNGAGATNFLASALATTASILEQKASYQRRDQEWQYQSQLAGYDIQLANQQIKISEDNVRIVTQEREIAQLNTDHAQDSLEFLKTKFTNAELYRWMGTVLEKSYSYMLNLATSVAKMAENQFYFEQQQAAGPFILDDYWAIAGANITSFTSTQATDRRGLTGSARLLQDVYRLDEYAFENTKRKLQMTKTISLAQNFPSEFQQFKSTGVLNFELTNQLFDYDFPGNYLRLINGVKTTVVGLVPVYDLIKATLTTGSTSYTVIQSNNVFQRIPIHRLETDMVTLTSTNKATGMFELQPTTQNELLNPFEGMGIESRWEFKMPQFSNRMDFSQIADIFIDVEYTALDSFQYRYQVLQDLDTTYLFSRGFSFKNDFPDQWYELSNAIAGTPEFGVTFQLKPENFPQGLNNITIDTSSRIQLYFVRKDGFTEEITVANFNLASNTNSDFGGNTVNGLFSPPQGLISLLSTPFVTLVLEFDNDPITRDLFVTGQIKDILLVFSCKSDLTPYPL